MRGAVFGDKERSQSADVAADRWETRDDIHEAFLAPGCALICRRRLVSLRRQQRAPVVRHLLQTLSLVGNPVVRRHERDPDRDHGSRMARSRSLSAASCVHRRDRASATRLGDTLRTARNTTSG